MTFTRACEHIENYSVAHESRAHLPGPERLAYPPDHIEVDNRLSWFLGALDKKFGDDAFYVHLTRDREAVARSHMKRIDSWGIMKAFAQVILVPETIEEWKMQGNVERTNEEKMQRCLNYCDTVNSNIALFLKDKSRTMHVRLEEAEGDYATFWERMGATGDFEAAVSEWSVRHNASGNGSRFPDKSLLRRVAGKCKRLVYGLPRYVREA